MSSITSESKDLQKIDRLCQKGELDQALREITALLQAEPLDRATQLYALLIRVVRDGPEACALEIENLRSLSAPNNDERRLIRKILMICHDTAERQHDEQKMWCYQRLLRRLVTDQPLDAPIPLTANGESPVDRKSVSAILKELGQLIWKVGATQAARLFNQIRHYLDSPIAARPEPLIVMLVLFTGLVAFYVSGQSHPSDNDDVKSNSSQPSFEVLSAVGVSVRDLTSRDQKSDLDAESLGMLRQFVDGKADTLKRHYVARMKEIADLAGEITVEILIDSGGGVKKIYEGGSNLVDFGFKQMLIEETRHWQFPALKQGEIAISVVYKFAPEAAPLSPLSAPQEGQELQPPK